HREWSILRECRTRPVRRRSRGPQPARGQGSRPWPNRTVAPSGTEDQVGSGPRGPAALVSCATYGGAVMAGVLPRRRRPRAQRPDRRPLGPVRLRLAGTTPVADAGLRHHRLSGFAATGRLTSAGPLVPSRGP